MKTLIIDFDGVIHRYSKKWHDGTIYDTPMPGAKEALERLIKKYKIVIFSTRNTDRVIKGKFQKNQVEEMKAWLKKWDIPYDEIYTGPGKPIGAVYVDDNALRFDSNWDNMENEIIKKASDGHGRTIWKCGCESRCRYSNHKEINHVNEICPKCKMESCLRDSVNSIKIGELLLTKKSIDELLLLGV